MNHPKSLTQCLTVMTLLALLLTGIHAFVAVSAASMAVNRAEIDEAGRTIEPATDVFPIANNSDIHEYNPKVAYGNDYYMVAYGKDGELYTAVYNSSGTLLKNFLIDNKTRWADSIPSIAYHAPTGLFLVAYFYEDPNSYRIFFTAVSPTNGQVGIIGNTSPGIGMDDKFPDVACAQTGNTCLLAFERNEQNIKGMYITLSNDGISSYSNLYDLADKNGQRPYITWGKDSGYYLLTYTNTRLVFSFLFVKFPVFTHIYDSNPGGGNPAYAHAAVDAYYDFTGMPNDKWATGAAYDPCTEKFILLWDYENETTNTDVAFSMIDKTAGTVHSMGWIAATDKSEYSGDISFVTDDSLPAACGLMDKLIVTYRNLDGVFQINAAELQGNSQVIDSSYSVDPKSKHLLVYEYPAFKNGNMSISSGSTLAEMFIAFNENLYTGIPNDDVYGRLVRVPVENNIYYHNYLPLLMR